MILKGIKMKKTGPNSVQNRLRILYPNLDQESLGDFHRLVMKYKHRAQARGMDYTNLSDEEWSIIFSDNLPKLEKGEKVHTSWTETVGKGLIEEAIDYLNRKSNDKLDEDSNVWEWLIIPSSIKLAARGIKQHNDFMLQASYLPSNLIDKVKEDLFNLQSKTAI